MVLQINFSQKDNYDLDICFIYRHVHCTYTYLNQGESGPWAVNYTSPKKLPTTFSYSLD